MERSAIRDGIKNIREPADILAPHYAEFIIGPTEGRTRWLHPGYIGRFHGIDLLGHGNIVDLLLAH
jgi:hypothetical protein